MAPTPQSSRADQPACQYPVLSPRGRAACAWPARPYRVTGMGGRTNRLSLLCRRHLAEVLAAGYQVSRAAPEELSCEQRVAGRACGEPAREVRVEGALAGVLRLCPQHEEALANSGVRVIDLPPIARLPASRRAG
jgi:hypothetical protein